jgi:two-component system response regulator
MTQPLAGKQILIVEDEPVFRSLLDSWLSSLGAETLVADDGVSALEQLDNASPDLMICDIAMPRMNGLKLVEHLRNKGDQMPVLVISATDNMADIAKALRLGVQDVLLKPVKDLNRLKETVFACLYPNMFNSRVEEEERLFQDWDALVENPRPRPNFYRNYSRRFSRRCRVAGLITASWCLPINPVWCLILRQYRHTIWLFIALM